MSKHANDLTAFLPFPETSSQAVACAVRASASERVSAAFQAAGHTRETVPIRLDQLDLRQMRAMRRPDSAYQSGRRPVSGLASERASDGGALAGAAAPFRDTRVRAVQQSASVDSDLDGSYLDGSDLDGSYLDLVGAVAVMALVLLAAILV